MKVENELKKAIELVSAKRRENESTSARRNRVKAFDADKLGGAIAALIKEREDMENRHEKELDELSGRFGKFGIDSDWDIDDEEVFRAIGGQVNVDEDFQTAKEILADLYGAENKTEFDAILKKNKIVWK